MFVSKNCTRMSNGIMAIHENQEENSDKFVKRLLKEVPKYKEILSANKNVPVKLIELADGLNLEFNLEREEFEKEIQDIIEKSRPAFEKILEKYPLDKIDEVEILGGGLRVPKVKEFISEILGQKNLGTHLNLDEAMAFGSAFIAANYSSNYQVQKVHLYQPIPQTVYLNITQKGGCENKDSEDCFSNHMVLFDEEKHNLGNKKTVKIDHHIDDMDVTLYTIDEQGNEQIVLTGKVRDVEKAKSRTVYSKDTVTARKLAIVFKYDKSGILNLKKAEVIVTETVEVKKTSKDDETETDTPPKTKKKEHTLALTVSEKFAGPQPMNSAQKHKSRKKLTDFEKRDKNVEKSKIIRNEYESSIYSARNFLNDDDNAAYIKTDDEKNKLLLFLDEEEDWLYEGGATADYDALKNKLKVLEKKIKPIEKRKKYRQQLPSEIEKIKAKLEENEKSFKKYIRKRDWLPDEHLEEYRKMVAEKRDYLNQKLQELAETPLHQKAPFSEDTVKQEITVVFEKLKYIKKIRQPKPPQEEVESKGDLASVEESEKQPESEKPSQNEDSKATSEDTLKEGEKDTIEAENVKLGEGQKLPENLQKQVEFLKEVQELKDKLLEGEIEYDQLTDEQKEWINY